MATDKFATVLIWREMNDVIKNIFLLSRWDQYRKIFIFAYLPIYRRMLRLFEQKEKKKRLYIDSVNKFESVIKKELINEEVN